MVISQSDQKDQSVKNQADLSIDQTGRRAADMATTENYTIWWDFINWCIFFSMQTMFKVFLWWQKWIFSWSTQRRTGILPRSRICSCQWQSSVPDSGLAGGQRQIVTNKNKQSAVISFNLTGYSLNLIQIYPNRVLLNLWFTWVQTYWKVGGTMVGDFPMFT